MIRRVSIAMFLAAFLAALLATTAMAKQVNGTANDDRLIGTAQADTIFGKGGNDRLFGLAGNDTLNGQIGNDRLYGEDGDDRMIGSEGNDYLQGAMGDDKLYGGIGADEIQAGPDDDEIFVRGESPDRVFCGFGFDVAHVSLNDLLGGSTVDEVLSSVTRADQVALSCEVLELNGLRIPLGAIAALPAPFEARVSLLLESVLRDGRLTPGETADLNQVFDLIAEGDEVGLAALLDDLLG